MNPVAATVHILPVNHSVVDPAADTAAVAGMAVPVNPAVDTAAVADMAGCCLESKELAENWKGTKALCFEAEVVLPVC